MNRTKIDDVAVFWESNPVPTNLSGLDVALETGLRFGCGTGDETPDTIGLTWLVQALALSSLSGTNVPESSLPGTSLPAQTVEATLDYDTAAFWVSGDPTDGARTMAQLCRALANPPLDRLPEVAEQLTPADPWFDEPTSATLFDRRYGPTWLGLARYAGPAFTSFTADQVRAHVATYFTAGNAVLTLFAAPPAGLRLPLPAGPRPAQTIAQSIRPSGPVWSTEWCPHPGLSIRTDDTPAQGVLYMLLCDLLKSRGSWMTDEAAIDAATSERVVAVPVKPARAAAAVERLWGDLRRLAADGPSRTELADTIASIQRASQTRMPGDEMNLASDGYLRDISSPPTISLHDELASVTAADVAAAAAAAIRTTLIVVPRGVRPVLPGVAEDHCPSSTIVPAGQVFGRGGFGPGGLGRVFGRRPVTDYLVLTGDAIVWVDGEGAAHTVAFRDAALLTSDPSLRVVRNPQGCVIVVDPDTYPGSEKIIRALDDAMAAPQARGHTQNSAAR